MRLMTQIKRNKSKSTEEQDVTPHGKNIELFIHLDPCERKEKTWWEENQIQDDGYKSTSELNKNYVLPGR